MTDSVIDDDNVLKDRLLRSLHRNLDGHLGANRRDHQPRTDDNAAVIYIYTNDADGYILHERYVYSDSALSYSQWRKVVYAEIAGVIAAKWRSFYGVYGWQTTRINATPMRTGDIFVKIDRDGVKSVRVSFNPKARKRKTHNET